MKIRFFKMKQIDIIMRNKFLQPTVALAVILLIVSAIALQSCNGEKKQVVEETHKYVIPDSLMRTLQLDTVKTIPLVNSITFTGIVDFDQDNQVNIFPLVSGNATDIKVQLGDYVTAGQALATIKSSEMATYSNNLIVAETNLTTMKRQLTATKDQFASGLASEVDVTVAQTNYDQAAAQLDMAKRILKINGDNKQGEWVARAPVSGFIVQKNITNAMSIRSDNGNNIFTISDLKNVWVWANVYESNVGNIHQGDEVSVTTISYPGRVFKGKVDKILNALDPTTKVMKVRIVISNEKYELKPQMFASIIIANPENRSAISVSSKALIYDNSRYYVLVYNGHGDASITPVEVLNSAGDKTYLKSGVKDGDRVISSQAIQIYGELNS
jgi:cobalt-zinc-cadmium efflux system membrane fusion protein